MIRYCFIFILAVMLAQAKAQWQKSSDFNVGATGKMSVHNSAVFCYGDNGPYLLYRSTDNGDTWTDIAAGVPQEFADIYSFNGRLYATYINSVYVSDDLGDSWASISTIPVQSGAIYGFTSYGTVLYAYSNRKSVFKSTDMGITWTEATINDSRDLNIIDFEALGDLYIAIVLNVGAFISEDAGQTWELINPTAAGAGLYMYNETIYCFSFAGGLFKYNLSEKKWDAANNGIADNGSFQIPKSMTGISNTVFVASSGLLSTQTLYYSSTDDGNTWTVLTMDGMPLTTPPSSLNMITANSSYLFSFYYTNNADAGVYRSPVSVTTSLNNMELLPGSFILEQNYPNPFNPATNFRFNVPESGFVTLKVFNSIGAEVATIVNESLSIGEHNYNWNAGNLASGVYFYRLQSKANTITKKLILMK